jgi:hypothetical protein
LNELNRSALSWQFSGFMVQSRRALFVPAF